MSKPKIIPYRILNSDPSEEPKLLVTNRLETKIKIKPKIRSNINTFNLKSEDYLASHPCTPNFTRPLTQHSPTTRSYNLPITIQQDVKNSSVISDQFKSSRSAENLVKLKGLIWDKKASAHNLSLNNSQDSITEEKPLLNPSVISKIYSFRPFLIPFIEEMRPKREEIENVSRNFNGDFKVTWTVKETFGDRPNTREGSQLVVIRGKIYMFGGQSRIKHTDIRQLDVPSWTWRILATTYVPQGRLGHSLVSYKGKIVLFGGQSQHSQNLGIRRCSRKIYYLSVDKKKWQFYSGEGQKPEARRHHAAAQLGKFMVVYGGMNQQGHILSDLYILDMKTKKWMFPDVVIETDPGPRTHATLTSIFEQSQKENYIDNIFKLNKIKNSIEFVNSGFYLFGGMVSEGVLTNDLLGLYIRDGKLVWSKIKNFIGNAPCPRYNHSACAIRGRLFIFGGRNDDLYKVKGESSLNDLFCFNVANLKWENIRIFGNLPQGRWGHCMVTYGSSIIMLGGLTNKNFMSADLNILETQREVLIDSHQEEMKSPDLGIYSYKERKKTLKMASSPNSLFKLS